MQSFFIIGGVTIGVAVVVMMSAVLSGLEVNFLKRMLAAQPHIQLLARDEVARPLRAGLELEQPTIQRPVQRVRSIDQWAKVRDQVLALPGIHLASPTVSGSALAVRGDVSRAINIIGIDPRTYFKMMPLADHIVAGTASISSEDVIVGKELAKDLGAEVGDKLTVQVANSGSRTLTITGIVDLGSKSVNQRISYVAIRIAESLLNLVGGATTIDLTVDDVYAAETIARKIESLFFVRADSWINTNAQFFTAFRAQVAGNILIRLFVALSVAFGIAAVLTVSVIQRSKEIGILRAMGTKRFSILTMFLIQGGVLGLIGSVVGCAIGIGGVIFWHQYTRDVDGSELFPLILNKSFFLATIVMATGTGIVAAVGPALRAAKLDPVVAIRG